MSYIKYQQGDVLLLKVNEETFKANQLNHRINKHETRAVLAEGEATGHYHAVYMDDLLKEAEITLCKNGEYSRAPTIFFSKDSKKILLYLENSEK